MHRLTQPSVAALLLVALATACGSSSAKPSSAADGGVSAAAAVAGTLVSVTAGDKSDTEQYLTVDPVTVKSGSTTFTFKNVGTRQHEMIVLKTDAPFDQLKVGGTTRSVRTPALVR